MGFRLSLVKLRETLGTCFFLFRKLASFGGLLGIGEIILSHIIHISLFSSFFPGYFLQYQKISFRTLPLTRSLTRKSPPFMIIASVFRHSSSIPFVRNLSCKYPIFFESQADFPPLKLHRPCKIILPLFPTDFRFPHKIGTHFLEFLHPQQCLINGNRISPCRTPRLAAKGSA